MNIGKPNRMSKLTCLLVFGLATPFLFLHVGCASTTYREAVYVSSDINEVEYLLSYGEWLEIAPYGLVWRPYVDSDWEPFYYGSWIWTDDGWAWKSDEAYGWLVYHYGYWGNDPLMGWFWIPGDTWSPARVQWYTYGDYTAWAPLPPPGLVWGTPWDPYVVNVWIVVHIDVFTYDNIGHYRIAEPSRRGITLRRVVTKAPPKKQRVEESLRMKEPTGKVGTRAVRGGRRVVSDQGRIKSDQERVVSDKKRVVSNQNNTVSDQSRNVSGQSRTVLDQIRKMFDQNRTVSDQSRKVSNQRRTISGQSRKMPDQSRTVSDQTRYAQRGDTARRQLTPQKSDRREVNRLSSADSRNGANSQKSEAARQKESSTGSGQTARRKR